jgi:predicted Zn-dependent protease
MTQRIRLTAICSIALALGLLTIGACARQPRGLYLVPMHGAPELVEPLAAYYREQLGLEVEILPAMQPPTGAFDEQRRQLIAERLIDMLRLTYAQQARSGSVIGITSWDMYIADRPWLFGFSWRQPPYAVVSYARMDPVKLGGFANRDRLMARLRKMVSRNVGIMLFDLPLNSNRDSLMYQDVMGVDELDRVDEDLAAAGFPIHAR